MSAHLSQLLPGNQGRLQLLRGHQRLLKVSGGIWRMGLEHRQAREPEAGREGRRLGHLQRAGALGACLNKYPQMYAYNHHRRLFI